MSRALLGDMRIQRVVYARRVRPFTIKICVVAVRNSSVRNPKYAGNVFLVIETRRRL